MYERRAYGYTIVDDENNTAYLTAVSKHCKFNGKFKLFISSEREKYLSFITATKTGGVGKLMINMYQ